jgi:hypothetical protein
MKLIHYRESVRQYGLPSALYEVAYRVAQRAAGVTIWNAVVVTMETVSKEFLADPKRVTGRFFGPKELAQAAKNPEYDLTDAFLARAFSRGDRCFAFTERGVLTSYGWYSTRPTEAAPDLVLHFDPAYAYMYKGFTLPRFRGQRLHALGMASALEAYTREGSKGLVSYVDSSNFASLRSCGRMGYETFGHVAFMKTKNGYVSHATRGCKAYGFRVEVAATRESERGSVPESIVSTESG